MQTPPYDSEGHWPQGAYQPSEPPYPPSSAYPPSQPLYPPAYSQPLYPPAYSQPLYPPQPYSQPVYPPSPPAYIQPIGYPPPVPWYPGYPMVVQRRPTGGAIAAEAILALFGIYGVGWLMSHKTTAGALLMIGGFVWDVFAIVAVILTAGFGFCLIFPLHLVFIAASTVTLSNQHLTP